MTRFLSMPCGRAGLSNGSSPFAMRSVQSAKLAMALSPYTPHPRRPERVARLAGALLDRIQPLLLARHRPERELARRRHPEHREPVHPWIDFRRLPRRRLAPG